MRPLLPNIVSNLQFQLTEVTPAVQPLAPDCNKSNRFLTFITFEIFKNELLTLEKPNKHFLPAD
jgi:hypothetical protein